MWPMIDAVQALPLVYSLASVLTLIYLSRKPVHLDQYESLRAKDQFDDSFVTTETTRSSESILDQAQERHQKRRFSGLTINLARLFLATAELGLALFSFTLVSSTQEGDEQPKESIAQYLIESSQIISWAYALVLSLAHIIRPAVANQFWIRTQLDLFNVLQFALSSVHVYYSDIWTAHPAEWPLALKLDSIAWFGSLLLVLAILFTRPYEPRILSKRLKKGQVSRVEATELSSSIAGRVAFSWLNSLVLLGHRRPIRDSDLSELEGVDQSIVSIRKYDTVNLARKGTFTHKLLISLRAEFFVQFLLALPWCVTVNISPYCLKKIIEYMECQECAPPGIRQYMYVFGILFATLGGAISRQQAEQCGRHMYMHVVSVTNSEIYAKALRRKDNSSLTEQQSQGRGSANVANLVAVDIKKLETPFSGLFKIYGLPLQFFIAAYQLYDLLGATAWIGIGFMIVTVPVPAVIFGITMQLFHQIMETKDSRMDTLNEMLSAIRIIKFFGWESKFEEKIRKARAAELQQTRSSFKLMMVASIIWQSIPLLNIVLVFVAYTVFFGNELSASKVFTTLALFNILRNVMDSLPQNIQSVTQASVCLGRINEFLQEEELARDTTVTVLNKDSKIRTVRTPSTHPIIGFENASFTWPNKENEKAPSKPEEEQPILSQEPEERFKLQNLTLDFPVGKLSLVVGPTGSGKSALLLSLLGELDRLEGTVYLPRLDYGDRHKRDRERKARGSGIAYVAQTAWLQNATIRDNILFGREYDQKRYDAVIEGCALLPDLTILESGDLTEIGELGITLSGGQKQRVSLARAIYSAADVLILDDCLSAVDSHTGKQLFRTLTGPLVQGRTVLMVTHQVQLTLSHADYVVVLKEGEVIGSGTPELAIRSRWIENVTLVSPISEHDQHDSETGTLNSEDTALKDNNKPVKKPLVKLIEDENKSEGTVSWRVYRIYALAAGGLFFWFGLSMIYLLHEFLEISQTGWLARWMNKLGESVGDPGSFGFNLGIYISLNIAFMLYGALCTLFLLNGVLNASQSLHDQLLHKISRAKVRFFDTTPLGRIVNRFSADMADVDENVGRSLAGLFICTCAVIGILTVITFNLPVFLIPGLFIVGVFVVIGAFYVPVSRDLKRLNANSRSPILNHFNETLAGQVTVRAYGLEHVFFTKNLIYLDNNNRTDWLLSSLARWLDFRASVAGSIVSFATGILILQNRGKIQAGSAALSLTYALLFTGIISEVIRSYAQHEMNMNAVERVAEYMDLEEEPPATIAGSRPAASWPQKGEIAINHLVMKYSPETPAVLHNVSLRFKAGEKVGIVGRTGSGKSTLAISLFRFMDPASGSIEIDGVNITSIGVQDLRTKLTIIPQDPTLFKGTLRSNLDPFGEREDRDLWEAVRRSHLVPSSATGPAVIEIADQAEGGEEEDTIVDPSKITLDTPVKENGSNFSQGQRQLIALARALVRQSKIIVMDEATASVDYETDVKIQQTIREEMSASTILTIAHRIRTIADFDRVVVLSAGEVAEFDKPLALMKKEGGLFRSLCEESSDYEGLLAIAEEKERKDAEASWS
ncbi:hypothetical protein BG006_004633 [Podila minutissima]|uniref:ATP-binding cassette transporter n=1 Tax=Podila minutissima TaxID=64525 RepID=A0A9P5VM85_9FUNG|nr:hypothetical protein BG006_004633 [Podila minutissima]